MLDIKGASVSPLEEKKVKEALAALAKDPHAPRELTVRVTLNVHNEYPKHVTVGLDENKKPIVEVVNSEEEEKAALADAAKKPE